MLPADQKPSRRRVGMVALLVLFVLIAALVLIPPIAGFRVCLGGTRATLGGAAMTRDSFVSAVRARGDSITLNPNAAGSGAWNLSGQAFDGVLDGQGISVYDYRTALGSYMETRCFIDANAIHPGWLGTVYIDTFRPTYWYRQGNLIVVYVGRDAHIPQVLRAILGPPFDATS